MEQCRTYSKMSSSPDCMLVTGPSGSGKTHFINYYVQQHNKPQGVILNTRVPLPATVQSIAEKFLRELGEPDPQFSSIRISTDRVIELINLKVELVILDEFEGCVDPNRGRVVYEVVDWIRTIINETSLPFVLFGLNQSKNIINSNEQLKRRFSIQHELKPYSYDSAEGLNQFRELLSELDMRLPFIESSLLAEEDVSKRIYYATDGVAGPILHLVRRAAVIAMNKDHDRIERGDFAETFDYMHLINQSKLNPFLTEHL
ncbi:ATP-binding protein [Aneurinibacillus sp. Ricciae_BoGa-3]|nr:ATP-binding protein [Aneurinibacillus sp. Ricciae_BoGa-3]WCK56865.1 ATP-binding protein [Aneurinibacillus sp. Ricciae_BoGa-3]